MSLMITHWQSCGMPSGPDSRPLLLRLLLQQPSHTVGPRANTPCWRPCGQLCCGRHDHRCCGRRAQRCCGRRHQRCCGRIPTMRCCGRECQSSPGLRCGSIGRRLLAALPLRRPPSALLLLRSCRRWCCRRFATSRGPHRFAARRDRTQKKAVAYTKTGGRVHKDRRSRTQRPAVAYTKIHKKNGGAYTKRPLAYTE